MDPRHLYMCVTLTHTHAHQKCVCNTENFNRHPSTGDRRAWRQNCWKRTMSNEGTGGGGGGEGDGKEEQKDKDEEQKEKVGIRRPKWCLKVTVHPEYSVTDYIDDGFLWLSTVLRQVLSWKTNSELQGTQCFRIQHVTSFCLLYSYSAIDRNYCQIWS